MQCRSSHTRTQQPRATYTVVQCSCSSRYEERQATPEKCMYIAHPYYSSARIYEMELRLDTPIKFRHPCYEALTWFAAKDYITELKSYSEKGIPPPIYLLEGMKEMLYCFSRWTRSREVSASSSLPPHLKYLCNYLLVKEGRGLFFGQYSTCIACYCCMCGFTCVSVYSM